MQTQIFYFTGTGTSLYISREIKERLGQAELIPLVSLLKNAQPCHIQAPRIGLVFPVYFLGIPPVVRQALEKMIFNPQTYVFAALPNGGDAGNTLRQLDHLLRKKGGRLHFGLDLALGDNSIVYHTSDTQLKQRIIAAGSGLESLVGAVEQHQTNSFDSPFDQRFKSEAMRWITFLAMTHYYRFNRQKVDGTRCSTCGLCARVCPVDNIQIKQGRVTFGSDCRWCFACLNDCPHQAIIFGKIQPTRDTRFHFPGISPAEVAAQKKPA